MKDKGFLQTAAQKIYEASSGSQGDSLILLPNKRAVKTFRDYFTQCCKNNSTLMLPVITDIDSLVCEAFPDIKKAENTELTALLYNVFCTVYDCFATQTADGFWSLGSVLLKDFDQIDKDLIDAKSLFRNLEEYKNLEQDPEGYLSPEQIELINKLFNTAFDENQDNNIRRNFSSLWNKMYNVYEQYNSLLDSLHLAYSGKLYRMFGNALENKSISFNGFKINIIGFSVLNNCEKKIFRLLKEQYNCSFFWDYDLFYKDDKLNEAGIFIRENLNMFTQDASMADFNVQKIETTPHLINIVASPYETTSLYYVNQWLKDFDQTKSEGEKAAIILCDEAFAPVAIRGIAAEFKDKINITMGYPFRQTNLYNELLDKLEKLWKEEGLDGEKTFGLIKQLYENLKNTQADDNALWQAGILKKADLILQGLINGLKYLEQGMLDIKSVMNIAKRELGGLSADIISDASADIQLMGMLETRALDFDRILLLSCNDDKLPDISADTSFIPQSFRKAYKMTDITRKSGVFAYYFYRLLHCAARADYVYVTAGGESKLKEKSRYIRQLEARIKISQPDGQTIRYKSLTGVSKISSPLRQYRIDHDEFKFVNNGGKSLSPSAINNLIHCEQKFYLNNIRMIREEIDDENYLAIAFGNIFHGSMSIFYKHLAEHKDCNAKEAKDLADLSVQEYLSLPANAKDLAVCGDTVYLNMIKKYMNDVHNLDKQEHSRHICSEKYYQTTLEINDTLTVNLSGRLDRMDLINTENENGVLRITDYKTGKPKAVSFTHLEDLFADFDMSVMRKDGLENIFEVLFYCYLVYKNENCTTIKPELMYLSQMQQRDIFIADSNSKSKETVYYDENLHRQFELLLKQLFTNLLSKQNGEYYGMFLNQKKCRWCDYRLLCSMGKTEKTTDQ
ncbi:MAG: PD-(D/E)XK nuclease family protein [Bacteroidales bacterium]|nr:PD-(D/E)XK nuclease family protein [Bacteroidales bacterium]MBP3254726.1 PD-(D/E)XK nuclease family protein [Bacteroidales bacterium]